LSFLNAFGLCFFLMIAPPRALSQKARGLTPTPVCNFSARVCEAAPCM
jgi:hypothetical protein